MDSTAFLQGDTIIMIFVFVCFVFMTFLFLRATHEMEELKKIYQRERTDISDELQAVKQQLEELIRFQAETATALRGVSSVSLPAPPAGREEADAGGPTPDGEEISFDDTEVVTQSVGPDERVIAPIGIETRRAMRQTEQEADSDGDLPPAPGVEAAKEAAGRAAAEVDPDGDDVEDKAFWEEANQTLSKLGEELFGSEYVTGEEPSAPASIPELQETKAAEPGTESEDSVGSLSDFENLDSFDDEPETPAQRAMREKALEEAAAASQSEEGESGEDDFDLSGLPGDESKGYLDGVLYDGEVESEGLDDIEDLGGIEDLESADELDDIEDIDDIAMETVDAGDDLDMDGLTDGLDAGLTPEDLTPEDLTPEDLTPEDLTPEDLTPEDLDTDDLDMDELDMDGLDPDGPDADGLDMQSLDMDSLDEDLDMDEVDKLDVSGLDDESSRRSGMPVFDDELLELDDDDQGILAPKKDTAAQGRDSALGGLDMDDLALGDLEAVDSSFDGDMENLDLDDLDELDDIGETSPAGQDTARTIIETPLDHTMVIDDLAGSPEAAGLVQPQTVQDKAYQEELDALEDLDGLDSIDDLEDLDELEGLDEEEPAEIKPSPDSQAAAELEALDSLNELDELDELDDLEEVEGPVQEPGMDVSADLDDLDVLDELDELEDVDDTSESVTLAPPAFGGPDAGGDDLLEDDLLEDDDELELDEDDLIDDDIADLPDLDVDDIPDIPDAAPYGQADEPEEDFESQAIQAGAMGMEDTLIFNRSHEADVRLGDQSTEDNLVLEALAVMGKGQNAQDKYPLPFNEEELLFDDDDDTLSGKITFGTGSSPAPKKEIPLFDEEDDETAAPESVDELDELGELEDDGLSLLDELEDDTPEAGDVAEPGVDQGGEEPASDIHLQETVIAESPEELGLDPRTRSAPSFEEEADEVSETLDLEAGKDKLDEDDILSELSDDDFDIDDLELELEGDEDSELMEKGVIEGPAEDGSEDPDLIFPGEEDRLFNSMRLKQPRTQPDVPSDLPPEAGDELPSLGLGEEDELEDFDELDMLTAEGKSGGMDLMDDLDIIDDDIRSSVPDNDQFDPPSSEDEGHDDAMDGLLVDGDIVLDDDDPDDDITELDVDDSTDEELSTPQGRMVDKLTLPTAEDFLSFEQQEKEAGSDRSKKGKDSNILDFILED